MPSESGRIEAVSIEKANVLGVPISLVDLDRAVDQIAAWIKGGQARYVCIRDAHGVILCQDDARLRAIHEQAGMVTPDGMPVLWMARWVSRGSAKRVYGPDLMKACLASAKLTATRHFFFGGSPGVADRLVEKCRETYPGLIVAGVYVPPFGDWSPMERQTALDAINAAKPDIVWVGLGTPKQEYWMAESVAALPGAVLVGVGAAFDFLAGLKPQAPLWMQRSGLEWIFRLLSEPRRLWRRYLKTVPRFLLLGLRQMLTTGRAPKLRG